MWYIQKLVLRLLTRKQHFKKHLWITVIRINFFKIRYINSKWRNFKYWKCIIIKLKLELRIK